MQTSPLTPTSFPKAIIHLDADAFFAAVEEAITPALRGKPVVTGQERGIIACANYTAKACGIKRGVTLSEARKRCPGLVVLPSDYETYSLYSMRMFEVMRRYTPVVEAYSVDEAFADITGLRRVFHCSYEEIARRMQNAITAELDITVSVGLSLTKSLAKLCSKFRKPNGFTAVRGRHIHLLLQRTALDTVWGFGPNTVNFLQKHRIETAYHYVCQPEAWAKKHLHKPGVDIWHELRGTSVWPVSPEEKTTYASIMKSRTFTPATADKTIVYARLVRNVESAFKKARRYTLRPKTLAIILRRNDFSHVGLEAKLNRPTSATQEALPLVHHLFDQVFEHGVHYRCTMAVLGKLESDKTNQMDLFDDQLRIDALRRLTAAVDQVNISRGKHKLCSATSLYLAGKKPCRRDLTPERRDTLKLKGETPRRRLGIPRIDLNV